MCAEAVLPRGQCLDLIVAWLVVLRPGVREQENRRAEPWACQGLCIYRLHLVPHSALWIDYIAVVPNEENGMVDWWVGPVLNG